MIVPSTRLNGSTKLHAKLSLQFVAFFVKTVVLANVPIRVPVDVGMMLYVV